MTENLEQVKREHQNREDLRCKLTREFPYERKKQSCFAPMRMAWYTQKKAKQQTQNFGYNAMTYHLIERTKDLEDAMKQLEGASRFYIDTEFNSQKQQTKLCLLQISDGQNVYLIDTIKLSALHALQPLFEQDDIEIVLHAGRTDLQLLLENLLLSKAPLIFDTQVAWGLLGPEHQVGLAYLEYKLLGIRMQKDHQTDDYRVRPLSKSQLDYAAGDVLHLPELYRKLSQALSDENKLELIHPVSAECCLRSQAKSKKISLETFRNAWQLDASGLAALHCLIDWYQQLPDEEKNGVPKPHVLFQIARQQPLSRKELACIKGVPSRFIRDYGDSLTGKISIAVAHSERDNFLALEPTPYTTFYEQRTSSWLNFAKTLVAEKIKIAPEIAFPSWLLRDMKQTLSKTQDFRSILHCLTGWRKSWLTPALSEVLDSKVHFIQVT